MSILKAYILPHGAITLNPQDHQDYPEAQELHDSLQAVGDEIVTLNPDLIVLTTPHGIGISKSFGVYINPKAYGTAEWENEWKEYSISVQLDKKVSEDLLAHIEEKKEVNIQGITAFAADASMPLGWGEVIPLWFINEAYQRKIKKDKANELPKKDETKEESKTNEAKELPKEDEANEPLKKDEAKEESKENSTNHLPPECVILSLPRRRLTEADKMISECLDLGKEMTDFLLKLEKKRIVLVFSGDLAHTHKITKGSYLTYEQKLGIEADTHRFDEAIEEWAKNPLEKEDTLLECGSINNKYKSCGYSGFVVLQGILKELATKKDFNIKSKVSCNYHPTYYGMIIASFDLLQNLP